MDNLRNRIYFETGWDDKGVARDYKKSEEGYGGMEADHQKVLSIIGNAKEIINRVDQNSDENPWDKIIREVRDELDGKTVLDLGSGPGGRLEREILPMVGKLIALDKSSYMLKELRADGDLAPYLDKILAIKGDMRSLPLRDNSVDISIANHVVHFIPDEKGELDFLREAIRTLKPGGYFIFNGVYNSACEKSARDFDRKRQEELEIMNRNKDRLKEVYRDFVFLDSRLPEQIRSLGFDCEVEPYFNGADKEFCAVKITKKSNKKNET